MIDEALSEAKAARVRRNADLESLVNLRTAELKLSNAQLETFVYSSALDSCNRCGSPAMAVETTAHLRGAGAYSDRKLFPLPTVVLLDLNMPKENGLEMLEWIRKQPRLGRIRVSILSASGRQEDVDRAFDLGANSSLVKISQIG